MLGLSRPNCDGWQVVQLKLQLAALRTGSCKMIDNQHFVAVGNKDN